MPNKITTASVLAFERKLDPSDAVLHAGRWDDCGNAIAWVPVKLREKSVRGTASHRLPKKEDADVLKRDMNVESPNPQTIDVATLPHDADTLRVQFTLRVLGDKDKPLSPSACNDAAYQQRLQQTVQSYVAEHGFAELARRYAFNLANARWLWRNRIGAEQVEVRIDDWENGISAKCWTFDALALHLPDFDAGAKAAELGEVAALLRDGLEGKRHVLLRVTAFVRVGAGQEVFPSQELILDRGRGDKSKTLYHVDHVAAIHSQKIGNALRTIDTWYGGLGPIAVEPYGSVTTQGKAYRQPRDKKDFYNLLDNWVLKGQPPGVDDQHYVVAVLIRGGVFGEAN